MIKTHKFIKKPLIVEVVEVTTENFQEVSEWCQGTTYENDGNPYIRVRVQKPLNVRQTQAYVGDWILYTEWGYKVYTTKAFRANFDPYEEETVHPEQTTMEEQEEAKA